MNEPDRMTGRERENPDPQELNRPVPRIILLLVAMLLAWAIYYIVTQAPGLESSSTPDAAQGAAPTPREG